MAYGFLEDVRADTPSALFRLGDAARSTTAADAMGGTAGSVRGGVTFAQASLISADADNSATFDGTGYVSVAERAALDFADNFTLEAWIYPTAYRDSGGLGGAIVDKGSGSAIIRFADALDGTFILRRNSVATLGTSTARVPLNQRSHVVVTKNGSTVKLYLNGADVTGTVTNSTMVNTASPFVIGAADGGANNFFTGRIDEVSVYQSALTARRVLSHYRAAWGVPKTFVRPVIALDQSFASAARTSLVVSNPRGTKENDIIVVVLKLHSSTVTAAGGTDFVVPTGGRQTNTITSKVHQLVVLWHRVRAGDPSTWTIAWDGSSLTTEAWARVYRGCPTSGDPFDVCAGAALTGAAGSVLPYASPNASGPGLACIAWASFAAHGFPNQPPNWHYGAGAPSGAAVGGFERSQPGDGQLPTPGGMTSSSDAWTTLEFVLKDGGMQTPAVNLPFGLDGVNSPNDRATPGWPDGYTPALAIGANFIRMDFGPGDSQSDRDAEFSDAAARGMRVLPVISQYQQISTINSTTFATYVSDFVARYGPGGAFWRGRTDAYLAPEFIEIFNEPWGTWFVTSVEPASYAALHIASVRAGRASNPRCKYIIAGIDQYYQSGWQPWFAPMFTAQPTLGTYVDAVSVHLYGTHPTDLTWWGNYSEWPQVESIVPDLYSRGLDIGGAVKLWVTEYGFNTASNQGASDYGVTERDQATMYLDALRLFFGRWADVIGGFFAYRYRDGTTDNASGRWGIVHSDNSDKPAKTALTAWVPQYQGEFMHRYGPDQWLPGGVFKYDGRAWAQPPSGVVAA